jgi:hypothetical protein
LWLRSQLCAEPRISLHYVRAHTSRLDDISQGNEVADTLAKAARVRLSQTPPAVTYDQDGIYLSFKDVILNSGVKTDIRKILCDLRAKIWKPLRQGKTMKSFRTNFQKSHKVMRAHAIASGNDKLWSYFVLATLRWLTPPPIAHGDYPACWHCQGNTKDTLIFWNVLV